MPDSPQSPSSDLGQLLGKLTGKSSCPGNGAFTTFLKNSPDPVLLFNEDAELIGKNQRAVELWNGDNNFIPPQLTMEINQVDASDAPFRQDKKKSLVPIRSKEEQRYFLPTIFSLLNVESDNSSLPYRRVIACILKDETVWKRSEQIRENLFSSISHELNTPLTSARLALYLLAEERIGKLNTNQQELVDRAKQDLDREIVTIQNVIDMVRSDSIRPSSNETESLNLHELTEETISDFESQIKAMELPVDRSYTNASLWVEIERETAELVFHQLFVSILKYTNEGARLEIGSSVDDGHCTLELTTRDGEQVDFPPDDLFAIEMESPRISKLRCADLGLRVAHEMIVLYGGTLSCKRFAASGVLRFRFPRLKR